jgi:phosphatidylinositol alpha-1,6-mannosyltransferase
VLKNVLGIISKERIDVVCVGELQELGWLVRVLRFFARVKVVIYTHGEEITTKSTSRFYGQNSKAYLNSADAVICVSNYTYKTILSRYNVSESKLYLITNGIDIDNYSFRSGKPCHIKAADGSSKLVFAAGRHIERKGFDMAIKAMDVVCRMIPDAHLVIAGEGETTSKLRQCIEELDLANTVSLVGRISHEELLAYYSQCDVFLMPNRTLKNGDTEGFGLVFLEANAFCKPVIGGNAGGVPDAIVDGKTGLLVDGASPDDIASAIINLLSDDARRRAMGEAAREWARSNDVKIKVAEFVDCCERLLA